MAVLAPLTFPWPGETVVSRVRHVSAPEEVESRADLLVIDSHVETLWGARLLCNTPRVVIRGGEECKDIHNLQELWKTFSEKGLNRESTVCVAGGGSLCDLGAMAASTWMRGIRLELVPTTLLCMVDACLGGKTAINAHGAKNQVGTFHPAEDITICSAFLSTLPERELQAGFSEAVKTALIGDPGIADCLKNRDFDGAVFRCLSVKGGIVLKDPHDRGIRRLLNLGHTLGHALEMLLSLSHGEAVALGMPAAARMGGAGAFALEIARVLSSFGLPVALPRPVSASEVLSLIRRDKKTGCAGRTWVVPRGWGDCSLVAIPPEREETLLEGVLRVIRP
jgi:3-dehydroquinate synthase